MLLSLIPFALPLRKHSDDPTLVLNLHWSDLFIDEMDRGSDRCVIPSKEEFLRKNFHWNSILSSSQDEIEYGLAPEGHWNELRIPLHLGATVRALDHIFIDLQLAEADCQAPIFIAAASLRALIASK